MMPATLSLANVWQEAETRVSDLSEFRPDIVSRVIYYIYTGDYQDDKIPYVFKQRCDNHTTPVLQGTRLLRGFSIFEVNMLVYILADMLGMEHLKTEASSRCQNKCATAYKSDHFPLVLKTLFENTREDDDLRLQISILVAKESKMPHKKHKKFGNVDEVFEKFDPKLWKICSGVVSGDRDKEREDCYAQVQAIMIRLKEFNLFCKHGERVKVTEPAPGLHHALEHAWADDECIVIKCNCNVCPEESDESE